MTHWHSLVVSVPDDGSTGVLVGFYEPRTQVDAWRSLYGVLTGVGAMDAAAVWAEHEGAVPVVLSGPAELYHHMVAECSGDCDRSIAARIRRELGEDFIYTLKSQAG
ncbi:hypothetical protein [Nocardiopsis potens]|uniref:hypothetical protein n=1 Tax=Nocardiopsis potens TaxID=1246458 RepID=UPI00034A4915|nr:hypothetical protein [Nocardiopsis potens]